MQPPTLHGQSTPRKRSSSLSVPMTGVAEDLNSSWSEPEKVIQLSERRVELKSLQMLATTFDLSSLKKRYIVHFTLVVQGRRSR